MTSITTTIKKYSTAVLSIAFLAALAVPRWYALAQSPDGGAGNQPPDGSAGNTGISPSDMLQNPLGGINTIPDFIAKVLEIIVKIGTPLVVLFIIYSGFLFVWARGSDEKLKKAKSTFFWTIIGAAILLGSWILAQAIVGTINELK